MAIEYVIGIDLGTTNTCVAIVDHGTPTVIAHKGGYRTTPSMLAISEGGRRLVGHLAKRQRETNRAHTVYGAKRLLGRKWGSEAAERTRAMVPYTLVEGPHGDIRLGIRDIVFSAAEVAALILQEVRLLAEGYVGVPIARAVITVPAYFNDNQRQATKDAGRIAGLDVLRIINEPTAAALAYGFGKELRRRVAVYDLGGGTFDFSILEIGDQVFEVLATAGDTFLGGQDFDERVVEYLVSTVEEEAGSGLRTDRIAIQRLRDAAERARCELSERDQVTLDLPFLHTTDDGTVHHLRQETLTRAQIESLTEDLVQRTITICDQALSDASLPVDAIEDVILVGGMTRMPRIRQRVAEFFGREPCTGINPDELVALGAAIQGTALLQPTSELILFDVTPQSLGVMIAGGYCHRLIDRNTTIPTKTGHVFTTYRDDQTSVKIVVLQGESDLATDNELLGLFILDGIRRAPRGEVQIDVTFAISVDGTVHVSAKDLDSGYEQTITVTASQSLPDDELARLADESSAYMIEARASEELSRRRRRAERLMTAISETLPQIREVMTGSRFGRETLEKIEGILHRGERELHLGDPHTLLAVTESLERASSMLLGIAERSRY